MIWSGRVNGQPASTVIFSAGRGVLIAHIATQPTKERNADHFQIRFLGGGLHVFRQIDPSKLAREGASSIAEPRAMNRRPARPILPDRSTCSSFGTGQASLG